MRKLALALVAGGLLVFAATSLAGQYGFKWSGWRGGTRDSSDWDAGSSGTHTWHKRSCGVNNEPPGGIPNGDFTVEIRRNRSFQPDVSLGVREFHCNNKNQGRNYYSGDDGDHHFRFPRVDRGEYGIYGRGRVDYPG